GPAGHTVEPIRVPHPRSTNNSFGDLMKELMLVGTAANRPNAIGWGYRRKPGGEWEKLTDCPDDASVQAITPHPERPDLLFAATRKGVYRSQNGGDSWTRLN